MSNEKPIIFNDEMIRAILGGRKTQTRRIIKPQPEGGAMWTPFAPQRYVNGVGNPLICRYGQPGDRLWVRETFAVLGDEDKHVLHYRATHPIKGSGWKPSIHMPRWASRITLEITSVRIERLQDISGEDSAAEGVTGPIGSPRAYGVVTKQFARDQFMRLWESINGPDSWHVNPWVWVIEFERIDQKGV
ncbi:hypothetical protein ACFPQA_04270 [Marinobacter koreensis]|uniref:Morphogenetic protein n=1 Tax=Marinobacter koreensis TaxID=335974 RepID=A0ABW0RMT4_9GAMM|nr:hypothetical protein [Marinobacter koreensis]MCK7547173.1 hypothetical protein [Marinobacter koreensis]